MASNASTRESTNESTNKKEIPIDTVDATPKLARRAKSSKSTPDSADGEDSRSGESTKADAKSKKTGKKSERVTTSKAKDALLRDELSVLDSVKTLIETGRKNGKVNRRDLTLAFKDSALGKQDFEGVLSLLREEDIPIAHTGPRTRAEAAKAKKVERASADDTGSADPVRAYLREMGQVSLLTREGEVDIAQRIELAVDAHLAALIGNSYCLRRMLEVGQYVRDGKLELKKVVEGLDDENAPAEEEVRQKFIAAMTRLEKLLDLTCCWPSGVRRIPRTWG